jgi:hypothetical protein
MTDLPAYERPNTISGLQAKRAELVKLRKGLVKEAKKVLCDIDHIDACIRLFDPKADIERVRLNRYATKHRAQKGQLKRFVLSTFRDATEPLTSRQITEAWIKDRGLRPDEDTFVILRKRIGACIVTAKNSNLVESVGQDGEYKLWTLKRGDQ